MEESEGENNEYEYEDIVWEKDEEEEEDNDEIEEEEVSDDFLPNGSYTIRKITEVDMTKPIEDLPKSKRRRTEVVRFTERDYILVMERCQEDIAASIEHFMQMMEICYDPDLLQALQGNLPHEVDHILAAFPPVFTSSLAEGFTQALFSLSEWFSEHFTIIANDDMTEEEGRDGSLSYEELFSLVWKHRAGSRIQLLQIFTVLLQLLFNRSGSNGSSSSNSSSGSNKNMKCSKKCRYRWVVGFDHPSLYPGDHPDLAMKNKNSNSTTAGAVVDLTAAASNTENKKAEKQSKKKLEPQCWLEVMLPKQGGGKQGQGQMTTAAAVAFTWYPLQPCHGMLTPTTLLSENNSNSNSSSCCISANYLQAWIYGQGQGHRPTSNGSNSKGGGKRSHPKKMVILPYMITIEKKMMTMKDNSSWVMKSKGQQGQEQQQQSKDVTLLTDVSLKYRSIAANAPSTSFAVATASGKKKNSSSSSRRRLVEAEIMCRSWFVSYLEILSSSIASAPPPSPTPHPTSTRSITNSSSNTTSATMLTATTMTTAIPCSSGSNRVEGDVIDLCSEDDEEEGEAEEEDGIVDLCHDNIELHNSSHSHSHSHSTDQQQLQQQQQQPFIELEDDDDTDSQAAEDKEDDEVDEEEDEEQRLRQEERQQQVQQEHAHLTRIPSSFQEFKDHPWYLLERHLKVDEVIHPDKRYLPGPKKGTTIATTTDDLTSSLQDTEEVETEEADAEVDTKGQEEDPMNTSNNEEEKKNEQMQERKKKTTVSQSLSNEIKKTDLKKSENNQIKKKFIGVFKGEFIYLQSDKEKLYTRQGWQRERSRIVLEGMEAVKIIKRSCRRRITKDNNNSNMHDMDDYDGLAMTTSSSSSTSNGRGKGHSDYEVREVPLYGIWQTKPLEVPAVVDGYIPRNEHGNLEIWDGLPQFVPKGAAYLPGGQLAIKAAKTFGIQYVPAVIGFDHRSNGGGGGGGVTNIPKIGGIVILQRDVDLIQDAIYQYQAIAEAEAIKQRYQIMVKKWSKLVTMLLSRHRLKETYGY